MLRQQLFAPDCREILAALFSGRKFIAQRRHIWCHTAGAIASIIFGKLSDKTKRSGE